MNYICDKVYCLIYEPYINERRNKLLSEFARIGLTDVKFIINEKRPNNITSEQSVAYGHMKCYMDALSKNYKRIIVMEDDILFLKDVNLLNIMLLNTPRDADVVLYDYHFYKQYPLLLNKLVNYPAPYIKLNAEDLRLGTCMLLTDKAMKHIIFNQLNNISYADYYTCYHIDSIDQNIDKSLKRYIPKINLCIQREYINTNSKRDKNNFHSYYRYQIINLNNYI